MVLLLRLQRDKAEMPDFAAIDKIYSAFHAAISAGRIAAAHTVREHGIAESVSKMALGNGIGFSFVRGFDESLLFSPEIGSIIAELEADADPDELFGRQGYAVLGTTTDVPAITVNATTITIEEIRKHWEAPLETIFPTALPVPSTLFDAPAHTVRNTLRATAKTARPRALVTVFPGTNCEYDSARAFERAGARPEVFVVRNLTAADIDYSIETLKKLLRESQILMIPGGFSAGDEPDGSGKFIAAFFRNPHLKDAVTELLQKRDGLCLGICNGFQALIKLGLVPWGEIRPLTPESPTLTFNTIGRHISRMARTKITSVKSPWLSKVNVGDIHAVPISHGEGRFVGPEPLIRSLFENGQVATRYVDHDSAFADTYAGNPNGSHCAIEGITSPDGRVLGKMGHSERRGMHVAKNVPGNKDQKIFEAGVGYFK
jgi:phosphoribosylformylglycinamidine synthase